MRGNSFANGASVNNGQGSPYGAAFQQGWLIRPASVWDHLEPRTPA